MKLTISNTVLQLEQIYMILNEHYYHSELPVVKIFITEGNRIKSDCFYLYGECSTGYKLVTCEDKITSPISMIVSELLHCMVHLYAKENGIKDTSGSGNTYHNKRFKAIAEAHGLVVDHHEKYGWSVTSPSLELMKFIDLHGWTAFGERKTSTVEISRDKIKFKPTPKPSSTRKYICPKCGLIVRATKFANIMCGDCKVKMKLDPQYLKYNKTAKFIYKE